MGEWTKVPPSEVGWYWWRENIDKLPIVLQIVLVTYNENCPPEAVIVGKSNVLRGFPSGGEWWTERIPEPPTGQQPLTETESPPC